MKNVASLKSTKIESPKTPGGISKSLLTPCRRVGLSRNWKKAGPSPFVSPVSGSIQNNVVNVEKEGTRKRKEPVPDDETVDLHKVTTPEGDSVNTDSGPSKAPNDIESTPTRHITLPRKKKSKLLDSKDKKSNTKSPLKPAQCNEENQEDTNNCTEQIKEPINQVIDILPLSHQTPSSVITEIEVKENVNTLELSKECVVVIQKRIFKTKVKDSQSMHKKGKDLDNIDHSYNTVSLDSEPVLQTVHDADSDDVPLCNLNKKERETLGPQKQPDIINIIEDDDFTETKPVKVVKLVDKNTSTGGLKSGKTKNRKRTTPKTQNDFKKPIDSKILSQNSFEEDDDFEFETKRTILIRKTYDKVSKPVKAKTTGSITQKDIDTLQARIEAKKKLLLAKAMTEDTKELRDLIKKWQKGCQDALAELMDLMKSKCPEKNYMDYSEMLQMLKIPANLVGYDSEDDCFNTPDDASIVLSKFNDI